MAGNALKLQAVSNQMLLLVLAMSELFVASSDARSDSGGGRKIEVGINTLLRDGSYTISIDEVRSWRAMQLDEKYLITNCYFSSVVVSRVYRHVVSSLAKTKLIKRSWIIGNSERPLVLYFFREMNDTCL